MIRLLALLVPGLALAAPLPHPDGPCGNHAYGMATGQSAVSFNIGGLGQGRRTCGRSEVALDAGGGLTVDLPNFYGALAAGARLSGSYAINDSVEVFGAWEFVRYEYLITPLSAAQVGMGFTNVGASWQFLKTTGAAAGVNGKVVLPTAVGILKNAAPMGFDLGVSGQFAPHPNIHLHANVQGLFSFAAGTGPADPRGGAAIGLGGEFRIATPFAISVDLQSQLGHDAPLDWLGAAFDLRWSDGKRFGFHLGALVPFLGAERSAVRLELGASVRFGRIEPEEVPKPGMKPKS